MPTVGLRYLVSISISFSRPLSGQFNLPNCLQYYQYRGTMSPDGSGTFSGLRGVLIDVNTHLIPEKLTEEWSSIRALLRRWNLWVTGIRGRLFKWTTAWCTGGTSVTFVCHYLNIIWKIKPEAQRKWSNFICFKNNKSSCKNEDETMPFCLGDVHTRAR